MIIGPLLCVVVLNLRSVRGLALSLAPEEVKASRDMVCILAQKELGLLDDEDYGVKTHSVLDGFDQGERDTILAKALGYFDGLLFDVAQPKDSRAVGRRLNAYVASPNCTSQHNRRTVSL